MPTAEFLRQKAREVRALIAVAKTPEVIAQLEIWARELEEQTAQVEALAAPPSVTQSSRQSDGRSNKRSPKVARA